MKTGIYKAVEKGNYEMIKFLTSKVKDPSTAQHVSFIPIHIAAYLGHTAIVELLAGFYDNPKDANSMCPHFETMSTFKLVQETTTETNMIHLNFQVMFEKLEKSYEEGNKLFVS